MQLHVLYITDAWTTIFCDITVSLSSNQFWTEKIGWCICSRLCYSNGFSMRLTLKLYFMAKELFINSYKLTLHSVYILANTEWGLAFWRILFQKLFGTSFLIKVTLDKSRPQKWLDKRSKSIIKSAPFGICNLANNRKQWVSNSDRFFKSPSSLACHKF